MTRDDHRGEPDDHNQEPGTPEITEITEFRLFEPSMPWNPGFLLSS